MQRSQHGVTPPSTFPSAQPALANVIANMTGEQETSTAFSSTAMPVDLHTDTNIQGNSYVHFGVLLSHKDPTEQSVPIAGTWRQSGISVTLRPH